MTMITDNVFAIDSKSISRKKALRVECALNAGLVVLYVLIFWFAIRHAVSSFVTTADILVDKPLALVDNSIDNALLFAWIVIGVFLSVVVVPLRHVHDYKDRKLGLKRFPVCGVIDITCFHSTELCRFFAKQLGQTDGKPFFREGKDTWGDEPRKIRNYFLLDRIGRWRNCRICVREGGSIYPRLILWDRDKSVEVNLTPLFDTSDDKGVRVIEPLFDQFLSVLREEQLPLADYEKRINNALSMRTG